MNDGGEGRAERAVRAWITGRVQGVGYRNWATQTARRLGVSGWVANRADGSVELFAQGEAAAVGLLLDACREGPGYARVEEVNASPDAPDRRIEGFREIR